MKIFIFCMIPIITYAVYNIFGVTSSLFFLIISLFQFLAWHVNKIFSILTEKHYAAELMIGRLRVRIDHLESSVFGNDTARQRYEYHMQLDREFYGSDDPDEMVIISEHMKHRDGNLPPIFTSFCGENGLDGRVKAIEEKLFGKTDNVD